MPLHPQFQAIREQRVLTAVAPLYSLSVEQARRDDLAAIRAGGGNPEPVFEVLEQLVPGPDGPVPVRLYRPSAQDGLPVLMYFFGGGWTLGSLDTSDGVCRKLANRVGCAVIAVGYRLAPEAKFPAAVWDCYAATAWVAAHGKEFGVDGERLAVGGDSAGGNLAAAVTLAARDRGGPRLAGSLLVYPNTDYQADTASLRDNTDPALFNRTSVAWYWDHYLSTPDDGADPLASPLRAASLAGLPPALVITAEFDPLRDEGEAYAHRLGEAGVPVELTRYEGMAHGFFTMTAILDAARAATDQAVRALQRWLHSV
jgi:acetyl esterase